MSDYSVSIKIAGEIDNSFISSLKGISESLSDLGAAAKAINKDINASGKFIKNVARDAHTGATSIKSLGTSVTGTGRRFNIFKSAIQGTKSGLSSLAKTAGKIGSATMKVTAKGIGVGSAAVAGLGTAAINVGKDFEKAMSQVDATMLLDRGTKEGQQAFETLENAARECGRSTAFSATEAAEALNYLALAGYDADKAATALPTVLNLAGAGAMDLAAASDMVTDSMSALKIDATEKNLKSFSDQLAQTASKSNTSVSQLGEAIIKVGGTASGLAGGTVELNTALGILADNGIKAAEGGTHLRNMIMSLQKARNSDAGAMFDDLGLDAYDKATGKMRSLGDIFGDLNKSLSGASAKEIDRTLSTIFKQTDLTSARAMLAATADSAKSLSSVLDASLAESGTSVSKLGIDIKGMAKDFDTSMSKQQFTKQMRKEFSLTKDQAGLLFNGLQSLASGTGNRFDELSKAVKDSAGACEDMYKKQQDNLEGDIDILKSSLSDLGISFYKDTGGAIRNITQAASGMVTQLNNAYKSGGLSAMLTETGDVMAQVVNGIATYAPAAVDTGIGLIQSLVDGITQNSAGIASAAGDVLTSFATGVFSLAPQIALTGIDIVLQLASSLTAQAPQLISSGVQAITGFVDGLMQRGPAIATTALNLIQTLASSVMANAPQLAGAGLQLVGGLFTGMTQMLPQLAQTGVQLIGSLLVGIIGMLPSLTQMGIQAILGLAQGLLSSLPSVLQAGTQVTVSLVDGITQSLPLIIQGGFQLITMLVQGIAQNLPSIAQAAVTIISSLIGGLVSAVPQLIGAALSLPIVFIDAILTTDWPSIGIELVTSLATGIIDGLKSIGSSVMNTIKGWFGGGEDETAAESGKSAASSYANGMQTGAAEVSNAASSLTSNAFTSIDLTGATAAGTQTGDAFSTSMASSIDIPDISNLMPTAPLAANVDTSALTQSMATAGTEGASALTDNFTTGSAGMTTAVDTLGSQVNTSLDTTWQTAGTTTQTAMQGMNQTVSTGANQMVSTIKSMSRSVVSTVQQMGSSIRTSLSNINLASSGTNMMQGLVNGIASMQSQVEAAAKNVATSAAKSVNKALQIHSPSRLMIKSGEYVDEGLAVGMKNNVSSVKAAAQASMAQPIINTRTQMQSAMTNPIVSIRERMQASRVHEALNQVMTATAIHNNTTNNKSESNPTFVFSPTYQIQGNASKDDIVKVSEMSQAKLEKFVEKLIRKHKRTGLA